MLSLKRVMVLGANGAIGSAWVDSLLASNECESVIAVVRSHHHVGDAVDSRVTYWVVDFDDESAIEEQFSQLDIELDAILVCTGVLHADELQPERSFIKFSRDNFMAVVEANTTVPMLAAKYGLPKLAKNKPVLFMALSARVGSISDNGLGGWYSYRASKAALNMLIKCLAIEYQRKNPHGMVVGMHPGTVDSGLSKPFQRNVPTLFSPAESVNYQQQVIKSLSAQATGKVFAWDGQVIEP